MKFLWALIIVALWLPSASFADTDPWEGLNRKTDSFNDWTDRKILRPTAKAYQRSIPAFIRGGIGNLFDNIGTPVVALNQLLQGKAKAGASDMSRFALNSTLGVGGLFDIATAVGLRKHEEDLGQTLGTWGLGTGNYIVVPLLGPSNIRDGAGALVSSLLNPLRFISPIEDRAAATAVYALDLRAELLGIDELVGGDRYLFMRDAYLQRRAFMVSDGRVEEDTFDDGFDSFEE